MSYGNIFNKDKLPDMLSEDEFNYYFKKFREGNLEVLDILVKHNIKLVYWYIEKYINCEDLDYDEVFSVGLEALIESFYKFNLSYNIKFSTFAITCIKNKILKYFRSESKHDKVLSLDKLISDSHNADTFGDIIIDDNINLEDDFIEKDFDMYLKKEVINILETFSELDKKIVMLYFGFYDGKTYVQKEICEILSISQSQVSKRLSSSLKKIRIKIESREIYNIDKEIKLTKKIA